jgi:hypothetical protein
MSALGHTLPQSPQFMGSTVMGVQVPPQRFV